MEIQRASYSERQINHPLFIIRQVNSTSYSNGKTPVYLNVYDLTSMNGYVHWAGLGITRAWKVEPRHCPGWKSIFIRTTSLDPVQVRDFMEQQSASYSGDTYHSLVKNCNHVCNDISYKLTGKSIPTWVKRLARLGSVCNRILPEALRISAVRHDPNFRPHDSEKRNLRGIFNCLSSVSMRQKHLSTSSLFLQSPLRGCLSPWELRKSINRSLKER